MHSFCTRADSHFICAHFNVQSVPKKSESADIEEPKLENEGTIEEELDVNISPTPADMKSPTSRTAKVSKKKKKRTTTKQTINTLFI